MKEKKVETPDVQAGFQIDKKLVKAHTVDDLSEIKVILPGREGWKEKL